MASGFSALAAALVVGARKDYGRQALLPHNSVYVLLGAGLLWFGWFGFNGGSGFSAATPACSPSSTRCSRPACALATWFVLDLIRSRQVTAIGAATAIVVGCVGITPAAGFISPIWAMVLGVVAALPGLRRDHAAPAHARRRDAGRARRARRRRLTGILFIGFVAQAAWNGVSDGLLYGNAAQLGDQALAVLAAPAYAFGATFALLKLIGLVIPLRVTEREEAIGMDVVQPRRGGLRHGRGRDPGRADRAARRGAAAQAGDGACGVLAGVGLARRRG